LHVGNILSVLLMVPSLNMKTQCGTKITCNQYISRAGNAVADAMGNPLAVTVLMTSLIVCTKLDTYTKYLFGTMEIMSCDPEKI
jgi:hypothetical protein